jgi:hypothetical protein
MWGSGCIFLALFLRLSDEYHNDIVDITVILLSSLFNVSSNMSGRSNEANQVGPGGRDSARERRPSEKVAKLGKNIYSVQLVTSAASVTASNIYLHS